MTGPSGWRKPDEGSATPRGAGRGSSRPAFSLAYNVYIRFFHPKKPACRFLLSISLSQILAAESAIQNMKYDFW